MHYKLIITGIKQELSLIHKIVYLSSLKAITLSFTNLLFGRVLRICNELLTVSVVEVRKPNMKVKSNTFTISGVIQHF